MAHAIVVGAGNIGSHLAPHLARMAGVTRVTVIDRDRYEARNVASQDVTPEDAGASKAGAQAARLARINPALAVAALDAAVEDVPLGALRAGVIVACVDSRAARLAINQAAWRLGVPWIDAGVDADGWLARVQVFVPGTPGAPCLECAWDQADYDAVEQVYACAGPAEAAATGAPSAIGALAASVQALECSKVLAGDLDRALVGRHVLIDARHHRHFVTACGRNPACRMPDHDGWRIGQMDAPPARLTLGDTLGRIGGDAPGTDVSIAGQRVALTLRCAACRAAVPAFALERLVRRAPPACADCGRPLEAAGFDLDDAVPVARVPRAALEAPLAGTGVAPGDVITIRRGGTATHYELGGS